MEFELTSLLCFVGILLGVLARAFMPYWRKMLDGEELKFEMRYIAIVVLSTITALQVFPDYTPVLDSLMLTFASAFIFGFGIQAVYTEVYAWIKGTVERSKK